MNYNLVINTIDKVLNYLDEGGYYNWKRNCVCNCGLFVSQMLDVRPEDIEDQLYNDGVYVVEKVHINGHRDNAEYCTMWSRESLKNYVCPSTGLNMVDVFDQLDAAGVDVDELELLSNVKVLDRLKQKGIGYALESRGFFEEYLKEWRQLLVEEQLQQTLNSLDSCFVEPVQCRLHTPVTV